MSGERRAACKLNLLLDALGVSVEQYDVMRDAFSGWLKDQAGDILRLAQRLLGVRSSDADSLLDAIRQYYTDARTPENVRTTVAVVSVLALKRIRKRLPKASALSDEWHEQFLGGYYADMDERLAEANRASIERVITRSDSADILDALTDRLSRWGTDRAGTMARNEVTMAYNTTLFAGIQRAGYYAVWKATSMECPACQALNGQTITTLKPPLHKGCTCTIEVGEPIKQFAPEDE